MLCFLNIRAASVMVASPSIVYSFFIISDAIIELGGTSLENPSVTISQSVTIPTGSSFLNITILPILSVFIFSAISLILESGEDEIIGLFITSLTKTLVVIFASLCLLPRSVPTSSICIIELNRSEEHTSELQSQSNLVCRLLLEKKKKNKITYTTSII